MVRIAPNIQKNKSDSVLDAKEVLMFVMNKRDEALQSLKDGDKTYDSAKLLHDATLACFNFGWMPPIRPSCICSTTVPSYTGETCTQVGTSLHAESYLLQLNVLD
jgi:hypothetical protein